MMTKQEATNRLVTEITAAFAGVPRSQTALAQLVITDRDGMSGDFDSHAYAQAGRNRQDQIWQDIDVAQIDAQDIFLFPHMSADDFSYFLPAHLIYTLQTDKAYDEMVGLFSRDKDDFYLSSFLKLNAVQMEAVISYLQFIKQYCDPWQELSLPEESGYWPQIPAVIIYWQNLLKAQIKTGAKKNEKVM